jgi:hypothetical protein
LRLLLKNFCKRTTESENREELKACPVTTLWSVCGAGPWCCETSCTAASRGGDPKRTERASAMQMLPAIWAHAA